LELPDSRARQERQDLVEQLETVVRPELLEPLELQDQLVLRGMLDLRVQPDSPDRQVPRVPSVSRVSRVSVDLPEQPVTVAPQESMVLPVSRDHRASRVRKDQLDHREFRVPRG
jgi:hypothetical protein